MERGRLIALLLVVVVLFACVLLALFCPHRAQAWELGRDGERVTLSRAVSSVPTSAPTAVAVYYGYKGGAVWSGSHSPFLPSSYASSRSFPAAPVSAGAYDVPLEPGNRCQLVHVTWSGEQPGSRAFAVLNDRTVVDVREAPPVTGTVDVLTAPPVSLDASASVSLSEEDRQTWQGIAFALALLVFVAGLFVYKAVGQ